MLKIRFSANILPFSWIVRAWCLSKVSHVEFIFDDKITILPAIGLNRTVMTLSRPYTWNWEFVLNLTQGEEQIIREWCESQIGVPYDYTALAPLNILIPRKKKHWHDSSCWTCSEFCAYAFHLIGRNLFDLNKKKITPEDLFNKIKNSNFSKAVTSKC